MQRVQKINSSLQSPVELELLLNWRNFFIVFSRILCYFTSTFWIKNFRLQFLFSFVRIPIIFRYCFILFVQIIEMNLLSWIFQWSNEIGRILLKLIWFKIRYVNYCLFSLTFFCILKYLILLHVFFPLPWFQPLFFFLSHFACWKIILHTMRVKRTTTGYGCSDYRLATA